MPGNLPAETSARVAAFLDKQARGRGRLIFAIDATGSREHSWDHAANLQAEMFVEAAKSGALQIQLVYFRGLRECSHSPWVTDARTLANMMGKVKCETGHTQYLRVLDHIRKEHQAQPVSAAVLIGDMCEEERATLRNAATGLGVPLFIFQEGDDRDAAIIFKDLASNTNGAYSQFSPNSARELAELLRAVAAYAAGGMKALAAAVQHSAGAARLLLQLR